MAQIEIMTVKCLREKIERYRGSQIVVVLSDEVAIDSELSSHIKIDYDNLELLTIHKLREIGRQLKVKNPTSRKKRELINEIRNRAVRFFVDGFFGK